MTPDQDAPVDNLHQLFASEIPWDMVEFSVVESTVQNSPENMELQKFWSEKQPASYSDYIYDRVSIPVSHALKDSFW